MMGVSRRKRAAVRVRMIAARPTNNLEFNFVLRRGSRPSFKPTYLHFTSSKRAAMAYFGPLGACRRKPSPAEGLQLAAPGERSGPVAPIELKLRPGSERRYPSAARSRW